MTIAAYLDSDEQLSLTVPWAARIAAARGDHLVLMVARPSRANGTSRRVDLDAAVAGDDADARVGVHVRGVLTKILGEGSWQPHAEDDEESDGAEVGRGPLRVSLWCLPGQDVEELRVRIAESKPRALVAVQEQVEGEAAESSERRRQILGSVTCEVMLIRPGRREEAASQGLLVAVGYGEHCGAALQLARDLARAEKRSVTALWVEPDIGPDAEAVGRRIATRIVKRWLPDEVSEMTVRAVVEARPHAGIARADSEEPAAAILLGSSKAVGLGGSMRRSVGMQLLRAAPEPTVILVRRSVPLVRRTQQRLAAWLERIVPQVERDQRRSLVERVQSNSHWDFDFIALMSLSTAIASMGLLADSAAVVIGAMLVAPLMTPLLGAAIGIAQGNPVLTRLALRSVILGFVTAFAIGWGLGSIGLAGEAPTGEMVARDWPDVLDLLVAFASGLAAAYASSRPGLLAALPGVAIAAALVPPIATAGLAAAMGEIELASGAVLLFAANMVAIVVASVVSFWAVGLRYPKEGSRWTRSVGRVLLVALLVLGVWLALLPRQYRPTAAPREFVEAVDRVVAELGEGDVRRLDIRVERESAERRVVVELGARQPPSDAMVARVEELVSLHFGTEVTSQLRWTWVVVGSR